MATQIRFNRGSLFAIVSAETVTFEQSGIALTYKFSRELMNTYYIDNNLGSDTTTRTLKKITDQNYVNKKVHSIRMVSSSNNKITGGAFKIYARRKF